MFVGHEVEIHAFPAFAPNHGGEEVLPGLARLRFGLEPGDEGFGQLPVSCRRDRGLLGGRIGTGCSGIEAPGGGSDGIRTIAEADSPGIWPRSMPNGSLPSSIELDEDRKRTVGTISGDGSRAGRIQRPFTAGGVNSMQQEQPETIMKKFAVAALTAAFAGGLLTASVADAQAGWRGHRGGYYGGYRGGYYGGYRRGPGIGGAIAAGAALGIIGGAIAASQAPRYPYGYGYGPAYGYGYAPYGYAPAYGYAPVYGY